MRLHIRHSSKVIAISRPIFEGFVHERETALSKGRRPTPGMPEIPSVDSNKGEIGVYTLYLRVLRLHSCVA